MTRAAHEQARAIVAPMVADVLEVIAADRGCAAAEIDALLCSAIESRLLARVVRLLEQPEGDRDTPFVPVDEEDVRRTRRRTPTLPFGVAGSRER